MEEPMMEFICTILKWSGVFIVILMGIGVVMAIIMVIFLIRYLWTYHRGDNSSEDDYDDEM